MAFQTFPILILMTSPSVPLVSLQKSSLSKRSLSVVATCPYQGSIIDFGFSGRLSYDKEGKVIPFSCEGIEGINGETAWIVIRNAEIKMLHGDTCLS